MSNTQCAARGLAGAEGGKAQIVVAARRLEGVAVALIEVIGAVLGVKVARGDIEPLGEVVLDLDPDVGGDVVAVLRGLADLGVRGLGGDVQARDGDVGCLLAVLRCLRSTAACAGRCGTTGSRRSM